MNLKAKIARRLDEAMKARLIYDGALTDRAWMEERTLYIYSRKPPSDLQERVRLGRRAELLATLALLEAKGRAAKTAFARVLDEDNGL